MISNYGPHVLKNSITGITSTVLQNDGFYNVV